MTWMATLTSKNQLTLPTELVSYASFQMGQKVYLKITDDNKIIMEKIPKFGQLQGMLADNELSKKYTTDQIINFAREKAAQEIAHEA